MRRTRLALLGACLLAVWSWAAVGAIPETPVAGDVTSDLLVDASDVQYVVNDVLDVEGYEGADIDYSGGVDASDVQLVVNAVLGFVIDADGDGLADMAEAALGGDPAVADTDGDGLADGVEAMLGTRLDNPDTDGDGVDDFTEVDQGRDPNGPDVPTVTSFAINEGAETTASRTVTLNNTAKLAEEYLASEASDFAGATWTAYSAAPTFELSPGDGVKTVYLKVRGALGESEAVQDTITLATPPTAGIEIRALSEHDLADLGLSGAATSGLNVVGVGSTVYLRAAWNDAGGDAVASYEWTVLSAPGTSAAAFSDAGAAEPSFAPDVKGKYEIGLVVTDEQGNASEQAVQVIHAANWVGSGIVDLAGTTVSNSTCTGCHSGAAAPNNFAEWVSTPHANTFARSLNGLLPWVSPGHQTVGFDEDPAAVNGGFDDVMASTGWSLPATRTDGVWEDLVANFPQLAKLGNVQCESCHGPASDHPAAAFGPDKKQAVSLDSGVCGQCHVEELEWANSGHSDGASPAFTEPVGPSRAACVKCHSGKAFIAFADGETTLPTEFQTHTCSVCHDPHSVANEAQLRIVGTVELPGGVSVDNAGPSATCMVCHNGRRAPATPPSSSYAHYSTAAENLMGVNAIDYGKYTYGNTVHKLLQNGAGQSLCVMCHMAAGPGNLHDDVDTQGETQVGGHTFRVTGGGFDNVPNACATCHSGLDTVNRTANGDYDGDGTVEGVQDEVQALLDLLLGAIEGSGVTHVDHHPYWENVTTDAQKQAIFNYELVSHDGSLGVHNTAFSVGVLQATYKEFTGTDVPGADIVYDVK
jgi:hypothetical protein